MIWTRSHRADGAALTLADRHYSRRKPGSPQFVPPGSPLVLVAPGAVWVSLRQVHQDHAWAPSWGNPMFHRDRTCGEVASEAIRQALAATRAEWGDPPGPWGMVTFVDPTKVRRKRDPGRCYLRAGFELVDETRGGHGRSPLLVFAMRPDRWPDPEPCQAWAPVQLSIPGAA